MLRGRGGKSHLRCLHDGDQRVVGMEKGFGVGRSSRKVEVQTCLHRFGSRCPI